MNCEVKGQHQTGIWPAPVQGFGPNQVFVLSGKGKNIKIFFTME